MKDQYYFPNTNSVFSPRNQLKLKGFQFSLLLFFVFVFWISPIQTNCQCPVPPICNPNAVEYCEEFSHFDWAIIPDGSGDYNIYATFPNAAPTLMVSFCLMTGNTVVECLSGNSVVFQKKPPLCYTLMVCFGNSINGNYGYCCIPLPCMGQEAECCQLRYHFYTNLEFPVWNFGDNTTSNESSPTHEYSNVNTYPGEGTPNIQVTASVNGIVRFQQQVNFSPGIYLGKDCQDLGNVSSVTNSINSALLVLPGLSHVGKKIAIKGSVKMDQNYQFSNCDFCMNPGSRIVSATPTLSFVAGTSLHEAPCKTGAWYGIELQSGSILGDNSIFTGAYNAIKVNHNLSNVVLKLKECIFERNYLGINVNSPVTFSIFNGNRFGNDAGILDWPGISTTCSWFQTIAKPSNLKPFAGIYATTPLGAGHPVVNIGFPGTLLGINRFVNLSNGIYLDDANGYIIQRCQFQNMLAGGYPNDDGMGIALFTRNFRRLTQFGLGKASANLTFENCVHAVLVEIPQTSSGNVLLESKLNNMNNVNHGYTLHGGISGTFRAQSYMRYNRIFYTGDYGILCENISPNSRIQINLNRIATNNSESFTTGISVVNFLPQPLGADYRIKIFDNTQGVGINFEDGIFGGGRGIAIQSTSHILVQNNIVSNFSIWGIANSDSPEDDIRCNTTSSSNGQIGILHYLSPNSLLEYNSTNNSNYGFGINAASNNTVIKCNRIGAHSVGLAFDSDAITGNQLPNSTSAGNVWNGPFSNWAAQLAPGGGAGSRFFYRIGEINPSQINSPTSPGWFSQVIPGETCANTGCPVVANTPKLASELDYQIANGTINPIGISGYLLKKSLFNSILYYPELPSGNSTLQSFNSSFNSSNGGKLAWNEKSISDGFKLSSSQTTQWNTSANNIELAFEQIRILDSLVQNGADPQAQTSQRAVLQQQILTEQGILNGLYSSNLTARMASASGIMQALSTISPNGLWEENEKTLGVLLANTAFVDILPTAIQKNQILQIAQQCVADGGPAVLRARIWYHTLTGISPEAICNGIVERENATITKDQAPFVITISPNPAQDILTIQIDKLPPPTAVLEIYDVNGKIKKSLQLSQEGKTLVVPIHELPNGLYFCLIHSDGEMLASTKVFIQH